MSRAISGVCEEAHVLSRVVLEPFRNFFFTGRAHDQRYIRRVFQWSSHNHKAFARKTVHERRVSIPMALLFQSKRGVPFVATRADDDE